MKAAVTYGDSGEVSSFTIKLDRTNILRGHMDGSTAVITSFKPHTGDDRVYADDVCAAMDFLETLPFAQAVTMEGNADE